MSKAFTREDDSAPEAELRPRPAVALPPGAKLHLTASGARRLKADLEQLSQQDRGQGSSAADPDAKRQAQIVASRIEELRQILGAAAIVEPPPPPWEQVRFGATVTVRNRSGVTEQYRIVGVAELDADRGWVSAVSPIGRTLLNARLGQRVRFRFPTGEDELEIVRIAYE